MLQQIDGPFSVKFYGLPIPILGQLLFFSKTELEGKNATANVYAIHITPFFSFGITIPVSNQFNDLAGA